MTGGLLKNVVQIIFILAVSNNTAYLQNLKGFTIRGVVSDVETGEALIDAEVKNLNNGRIVYSDLYGYFSISDVGDQDSISISSFGFKSELILFNQHDNKIFNIILHPVELPQVEVRSDRILSRKVSDMVSVSANDMKRTPFVLGEADPLKTAMLMPGISSGREGTSGILLRGGNPSENIVLYDEAQLYNTNHLFGFLSTFNPDIVQQVDIYKGYFSPEYGDGLSGLIHNQTKEGNYKERKQKVSIGLISSRYTIEGPLIKDRLSYIASVRLSYLSILMLPFNLAYSRRGWDNLFQYSMFDGNIKLNYKLKNGGGIFYSFYSGFDYFKVGFQEALNSEYSKNEISTRYGNNMHSIRWIHPLASRQLSIKSYLSYTAYKARNTSSFLSESNEGDIENILRQRNSLHRLHARTKLQFYWQNLELTAGADASFFSFLPIDIKNEINGTITTSQGFKIPRWNTGLFGEFVYSLPFNFGISGGLRWSHIRQGTFQLSMPEPRLLLSFAPAKNQIIKLSFTRLAQTLHGLINRNSLTGVDNWLPATENLIPSRVNSYSLNYTYSSPGRFVLTGSVFSKYWSDLVELKPDASFFVLNQNNWENNFIPGGKGKAVGFELFTKMNLGNTYVQIGYTWMKNERLFSEINNGNWFPSHFERRHDLSLLLHYKFSDKWNASLLWAYHSPIPFTLPIGVRLDENNTPIPVYDLINNQRLNPYHRLDLSVSRILKKSTTKTTELNFSVYNLYNRFNISSIYFLYRNIPREDSNGTRRVIFPRKFALFPFIPSVSYTINF